MKGFYAWRMKYDKAWKCDMMASGMCSVGYGKINRSSRIYFSNIWNASLAIFRWYDKNSI